MKLSSESAKPRSAPSAEPTHRHRRKQERDGHSRTKGGEQGLILDGRTFSDCTSDRASSGRPWRPQSPPEQTSERDASIRGMQGSASGWARTHYFAGRGEGVQQVKPTERQFTVKSARQSVALLVACPVSEMLPEAFRAAQREQSRMTNRACNGAQLMRQLTGTPSPRPDSTP